MDHVFASVDRGWRPAILVPSEPQEVEKKLFHKEINVGKTKQAIRYSDSLNGVSSQINEFIHY